MYVCVCLSVVIRWIQYKQPQNSREQEENNAIATSYFMCIHCSIDHTPLIMNKEVSKRQTKKKSRARHSEFLYAPQSLVFLMKIAMRHSDCINTIRPAKRILLLVCNHRRHFFLLSIPGLLFCKRKKNNIRLLFGLFIIINTVTFRYARKLVWQNIAFERISSEFVCFFFSLFIDQKWRIIFDSCGTCAHFALKNRHCSALPLTIR